jgi:hypothetical protein
VLRRFSSGSGYFGSTSVPVLFSRFFWLLGFVVTLDKLEAILGMIVGHL